MSLTNLLTPALACRSRKQKRRDVEPNTVVRVLRKGYRQQQRVLRYAEVVVAQARQNCRFGKKHTMPANNGKIIGINMGTTDSVLGVIRGAARCCWMCWGTPVPSVVGVSPQNDLLVGTPHAISG